MKTFICVVSMLWASAALAVPVNLSTFAPPSNPQCALTGTDVTTSGQPQTARITVAIGDTVSVALVVSNGAFTGPNIISINDATPPQYNVTLPIQVTTSAAGVWDLEFVTPGCAGQGLIITSH